jgi:hypothetical protein
MLKRAGNKILAAAYLCFGWLALRWFKFWRTR